MPKAGRELNISVPLWGSLFTKGKPLVSASLYKNPWLISAVAVVVALTAAYSVCLVSPTLITHEKSVLTLPILSHARNIPLVFSRDFLIHSSGQFRPLSYAVLAFLRTFVDSTNLLFWHLWLLGFHIVNTLLLFAIARHFTQRLAVALTSAAIFGLHPVATVIVNDVNQFYMLMGLSFCLGSLKAYLSFWRTGNRFFYLVSVVCFVLGLATAKVTLSVGLILFVYELVHQRTTLRRALVRLCPFAFISVLALPLLLLYNPHPLHYRYVPLHEKSFWHGLFSVVGASGQYANGLFLTRGIPAVFHEIVEKIYRWNSLKFIFWAILDFMILGSSIVALVRKRWFGLGVVMMFASMAPYISVGWNRVVDYVSWVYLYFPVAGFALFAAGVCEVFPQVRARQLKTSLKIMFVAFLLFLTGRTVHLNLYTRSPVEYWFHVWELNPNSQTALYEAGKAYLERGELSLALHFFFAPMVEDLTYPSLEMARYYAVNGDYLASAIHLRFGLTEQKVGIVLEEHSMVAGELLAVAGALDHAEEHFGKVLMVDPFNTKVMGALARVWFLKGFVSEAHRMLARGRLLAPRDENLIDLERRFGEKEMVWRDHPEFYSVKPPLPDWLRYVLTQARSRSLRQQIIALSDECDPNDAVIQLEGTISLLENEEYELAASKAEEVIRCLSGSSYACAVACRAFALAGETERAVPLGIRAVFLDRESKLAWGSLAIAASQQDKPDAAMQSFIESVDQNPAAASEFYYNLALRKVEIGRTEEAVQLFEKAVNARPDNVDAQRALGIALRNIGQFREAAVVLQKAVSMDPSDAEAHAHLGWAFLKESRYIESVAALRTAVKLDPQNAVYHNNLGLALVEMDRRGEAMDAYRRAIALNPGFASPHYNLANSLVRIGKLAEALVEYREAIKIMPGHPYAHFNLAAVLYQLGKIDEAIAEYREEIRYNVNCAAAYERLIIHYCEKGEYSLAQSAAVEARALDLKLDPAALANLSRKFGKKEQ